MPPAIFLGVAAFLLNVVLARLIGTQRQRDRHAQGLRLLGRAIALHYLEFAAASSSGSARAGDAPGDWPRDLARRLYARYYRFPRWRSTDSGIVVPASRWRQPRRLDGRARLGAPRRRAPPAEAMRPEAPAGFGIGPIERLVGGSFGSPASRMVLRGIERRPMKALLSVAGITLATAIVVTGWWMFDAIGVMKEIQFDEVDRYDVMVSFDETRGNARGMVLVASARRACGRGFPCGARTAPKRPPGAAERHHGT